MGEKQRTMANNFWHLKLQMFVDDLGGTDQLQDQGFVRQVVIQENGFTLAFLHGMPYKPTCGRCIPEKTTDVSSMKPDLIDGI